MNKLELNIFIANLNAYNNGELKGKWFDLTTEYDQAVEYADQFEEYVITDYECSLRNIGEYEALEDLTELIELITDANENDQAELVAVLYEHYGYIEDVKPLIDNYGYIEITPEFNESEHYTIGYYVAVELDCLGLNELTERYFDFDAYGHDLLLGGDIDYIGEANGNYIYVFG